MCGVTVNDLSSALEAAELLAKRFSQVVVTAGEHGVAFCEAGIAGSTLAARRIKLVSTHGAGDCFMGVLCTSLMHGEALRDAVFRANEAAARHVSQPRA